MKTVFFLKKLGSIKKCSCHCFLLLIIALHLSANSHQSRHDAAFSCLLTSLPQMSHSAVSSSVQISTLPAQLGHWIYSGLGRRKFLIPGHDSGLRFSIFSSPSYDSFSPLTLMVSCFKGTCFPESSIASWTTSFNPKQHGTSMFTTVTLLMSAVRNISANLFL